jgi:hypothetical protein
MAGFLFSSWFLQSDLAWFDIHWQIQQFITFYVSSKVIFSFRQVSTWNWTKVFVSFSLSIANTTSFYIYLVYRYFHFDISFKLFRQPTFWKQHIKWFISWQKSWKCCEIRKEILDFNNFVDLTKLYIDLMHRLDPKISLMWIRLFEPLLFSILQFLDII